MLRLDVYFVVRKVTVVISSNTEVEVLVDKETKEGSTVVLI